MPHPSHAARHGFTLIELLVVIAIIAILASILFPVFSKARESARRTTCLSNERQLGLAFAMYAQDYDETMPGAWVGGGGNGKQGGWVYYAKFPANDPTINPDGYDVTQGSVYSYIKNAGIFVCPSDSIGKRAGSSYAVNSCALNGESNGLASGKTLAAFDAPSDMMLLGEETETGPTGSSDDGYMRISDNPAAPRHLEGCNIAFVDGHVKGVRANKQNINRYQRGGTDGDSCP